MMKALLGFSLPELMRIGSAVSGAAQALQEDIDHDLFEIRQLVTIEKRIADAITTEAARRQRTGQPAMMAEEIEAMGGAGFVERAKARIERYQREQAGEST